MCLPIFSFIDFFYCFLHNISTILGGLLSPTFIITWPACMLYVHFLPCDFFYVFYSSWHLTISTASSLVFVALKYNSHLSLKNFFLIFAKPHRPGFPIASYSPGLNFKHLMQNRFPQYTHSNHIYI